MEPCFLKWGFVIRKDGIFVLCFIKDSLVHFSSLLFLAGCSFLIRALYIRGGLFLFLCGYKKRAGAVYELFRFFFAKIVDLK
jgi:hypothetical protein